jgi:hypothetical protein
MTISGYAKLGTVIAALALAACGGDSKTANGSDGGTGATGGGGSGGTGSSCNIPCFASLFAQCAPAGACTTQGANICYANGVKFITTLNPAAGSATTTIYKPGGAVCFTGANAISAQAVTTTYKDASGNTVATGTYDTGTGKTTIMCNGKAYDLADCQAVGGGTGNGSSCSQGTCM